MEKKFFNLPIGALAVGALAPTLAQAQAEKPMNIVYIMSDDHSYQTISAYDNRFAETPNIDWIAQNGVRFTKSFVANSLSGPSRACMLTGKHSHINGFTDNTRTFDGAQQTYPKLLQKAGYQTAMIGKWHLTSEPTGFDYWDILIGQGDYYNPDFIRNGEKVKRMGYSTNITTGGYVGSEMYTTHIPAVISDFLTPDFGSNLLSFPCYLSNAINASSARDSGLTGGSSAGAWSDEKAILPGEVQVYGTKAYGNARDIGNHKQQLAMFREYGYNKVVGRDSIWLRDVASSASFAFAASYGSVNINTASNPFGVRPLFVLGT